MSSKFECELCKIDCKSRGALREHKRGKRHTKKEKLLKEKKSSVVKKGFGGAIIERELAQDEFTVVLGSVNRDVLHEEKELAEEYENVSSPRHTGHVPQYYEQSNNKLSHVDMQRWSKGVPIFDEYERKTSMYFLNEFAQFGRLQPSLNPQGDWLYLNLKEPFCATIIGVRLKL